LTLAIRATSRSAPIVIAITQMACATVPMARDRPIEVDSGFLSTRYTQQGQTLDRGDMLQKLEREADSASDASRARVLQIIATGLAAVGGALIGWPLGQKITGQDPTWPLAYVGAGVVAVSLPLGIWADTSVASAVQAHNRRFETEQKGGARAALASAFHSLAAIARGEHHRAEGPLQ
jgi:hypothetical protein